MASSYEKITSTQKLEIVNLYNTGLILKDIGLIYGVAPYIISRVLSDQGIPIRRPGFGHELSKEKVIDILRLYSDEAMNIHEIGNRLGVASSTVLRYVRKAGVVRSAVRRRVLSDSQIEEACILYKEGNSIKSIAKHFKCSTPAVHDYIRYKVPMRNSGGQIFKTETSINEISSCYKNGEALSSLATRYNVSRDAILTVLKNKGISVRGPNEACGFPFKDRYGRSFWMRSSWEVKFAKYLDILGVKWDYEVTKFELPYNMTYLPDFWIYNKETSDIICIVDIKGWFRPKSRKRVSLFKQHYSNFQFLLLEETELILLGVLPERTKTGRKKCYKPTMDQKIIELYNSGKGSKIISKKLNIGSRLVLRVVEAEGIKRSPAEAAAIRDQQRKRICSLECCSRKHYGRGLCSMHYQRAQKTLVGAVDLEV
jgi:predicted DNA-binding protein YlxM (UPF0122 family)/transposase-like protein